MTYSESHYLHSYVQYSFFSPDFSFSVDPDTGTLSLAQTLDRETVSEISLVVMATDQGIGNNKDNVSQLFEEQLPDNCPSVAQLVRAVDCRGVVIHRSLVQLRPEGLNFFFFAPFFFFRSQFLSM